MGNSPSTLDGKDVNRLSKQKSNYSISSSALDSPSLRPDLLRSATNLRAVSADEEALLDLQSGQRGSRSDLRQHFRAQLQSDDQSPPYTADHAKLRPAASRERLSQSLSPEPSYSTMPYGYNSQSSSSLAVDPRTVDLQTAVDILQELRKTASPEDLVALRRFTRALRCPIIC